jgi:hypothetical protein
MRVTWLFLLFWAVSGIAEYSVEEPLAIAWWHYINTISGSAALGVGIFMFLALIEKKKNEPTSQP